jgi:hypothetical protein
MEVILSNVKYILLVLEGIAFLGHSKPRMGPSTECNPHQFEPPTDSHCWHHRKRKEAHLHTR